MDHQSLSESSIGIQMGQTIAEKILSRQNVAGVPVKAGDLIDARVDGLMVRQWASVRATYKKMGFNGPPVVWNRNKTYVMLEHNQPPAEEGAARGNYETRLDVQRLGLPYFY